MNRNNDENDGAHLHGNENNGHINANDKSSSITSHEHTCQNSTISDKEATASSRGEQKSERNQLSEQANKSKVAAEVKKHQREHHSQRIALFGARALAAGGKRRVDANWQATHRSSSHVHPSLSGKASDAYKYHDNENSEITIHHSREETPYNTDKSSADKELVKANEGSVLHLSEQSHSTQSYHSSYALSSFGAHRSNAMERYSPARGEIDSSNKYLVIGDNLMSPFMALCLRVHGIECDLAQHETNNDLDRGTIVLTPSVTQLMGDVLSVSVPSGSVVGRILTFDHVGNDLCDLDLNEYREKGESPTFFCCDRIKVERALLSLCEIGMNSCTVLPKPLIERNGLEALDNGRVRVRFSSGLYVEYRGVICTARNINLWPELTLSNTELQQRAENAEMYKKSLNQAARWLEVCVPPLPELGKFEKRFTPGSQEIVEILTPRETKMTVRPTMMATKLFYNVTLTIPDGVSDPRLRSTSTRQFWDDVIAHWTSNIPGYVSHTMFRPMIQHIQEHLSRNNALVYRSPLYFLPHWTEGEGRIIKVGQASHSSCFDAIDVSDAQSFTDCFALARALASNQNVTEFVKERQLEVLEEMDHHKRLIEFNLKERRQMMYMYSRFKMKFLRQYKKSWRAILKNYVTMMPKTAV